MIRTITVSMPAVVALLLGGPAAAEEASAGLETEAGRLNVSLAAGVVFPQLKSELGTTGGVQLSAGWRAWKRLVPFFALGYHQPHTSTFQPDPRLSGDYRSDTTQRELTTTVGAFWRMLPADAPLNAYGGLAARVWFLDTRSNGWSGGNMFLENRETSTRLGAAALFGGEYRVGPGAAMLEIDIGGSDLPHVITGDVATTAISFLAGYRLLLL